MIKLVNDQGSSLRNQVIQDLAHQYGMVHKPMTWLSECTRHYKKAQRKVPTITH